VNKSESVDARLGPLAVQRSCRVGDRGGDRVGRCISDCGGEDKLESLIFTIVLMMLMNIAVILMILMSIVVILMIILTVGDKKSGWKTLTVAPWHQHVTIRGYYPWIS
jgi:hypothetical protein